MRLDQLDLREAGAEPRRLVELRVGEVDAHDPSRVTNEDRRAEQVGARSRAEVEDRMAGPQRGEIEVIADAGERRQGLGGDGVEQPGRVAELLGEVPPHLEVQVGAVEAPLGGTRP